MCCDIFIFGGHLEIQDGHHSSNLEPIVWAYAVSQLLMHIENRNLVLVFNN